MHYFLVQVSKTTKSLTALLNSDGIQTGYKADAVLLTNINFIQIKR